jgi:putative glutamine amidotransferase
MLMRPRIAVPVPHSRDSKYVTRALPQYEKAVETSGGEAVRIPLDHNRAEITKLIESCDGVLLPGSPADVDPEKYNAARHPKTAAADSERDAVDQLLLHDAYQQHKPVLGICYGQQSLNVYRSGSLLQHIESPVKHEAGKVAVAHAVQVEPGSRLAKILREVGADLAHLPVNSSHHQSVDAAGEGLRIVSRCPADGIVEAIESISPDHFVLAVQWHPERSLQRDEASRALFRALVEAAQEAVQNDKSRRNPT